MGGARVYCASRLFDGERFVENGCVAVEAGRILAAGPRGEVEAPRGAEEVWLGGRTLMPGLIDAHVHYTGLRSGDIIKESLLTPYATLVARAIGDLERTLMAGYTTIVDAGGVIALQLKQAQAEGSIRAPRIVAAGYPVSQTFGHGDTHFLPPEYVDPRTSRLTLAFTSLLCDGPSECRKAARYALRLGADFIKIFTTGGVVSQRDRPEYPQMTPEEIRAVVEEARRAGRFVHAHAEGLQGIVNALEAGVEVIAHAMYMDDHAAALAVERGAVVVPTLTIVDLITRAGEAAGLPDWALEKAREAQKAHVESIRRAYKAGVTLATGTDLFTAMGELNPYGMNSMEILLLVNEVGMEPREALQAATKNAAKAAGLEGVTGQLKPGYKADIIAVKGDPEHDPTVLLGPENIDLVILEGKTIKTPRED
ncbi:MAG: amidohydrolase family protein [Desulfurococcales archaeon]|nr:amidohydrolase family protein [Desulfurococcales archaeon]